MTAGPAQTKSVLTRFKVEFNAIAAGSCSLHCRCIASSFYAATAGTRGLSKLAKQNTALVEQCDGVFNEKKALLK